MRKRQSLNTFWKYRIGKGEYTQKKIPFSALPVGLSECTLDFAPNCDGERVFLVLDGKLIIG